MTPLGSTHPSLILWLLCGVILPGGTWSHQVRPACPREAKVCEFYLEITSSTSMTQLQEDGSPWVLDVDKDGQVHRVVHSCGTSLPVEDIDLSKVPLGDGSYKRVLLYNNTLPGPPIVVYEGQQVMVRLWNRMKTVGTTVHFHGAKQLNTPWMDGVAGVSQCSILPGERFTYRFLADPIGTHWYHSHYGSQRSMGAAGPFIVLERDEETAKQRRGDSPLPKFDDDFYMMVQDWYRERNEDTFIMVKYDAVKYSYNYRPDICYNSTKQYDWVDSGVLPFVSAILNGRGRYMGQDPRYPKPTFLPYEVYKVRRVEYYRFRVIGASLQFPLQVSIDHHPLYVIASDGSHLKTKAMDSIIVYNGERYDFYIETKDPLSLGNYWIRVQTIEHFQDGHTIKPGYVKAILRYDGAPIAEPTTLPRECTKKEPCHVSNCPYATEVTAADNIKCHPITDFRQPQQEPTLQPEHREDVHEVFLNYHFAITDINQPDPITTSDNITWQPRDGTEKPTINGVHNILPVASVMTYPETPDENLRHCHFVSCPVGLCRKCEHHIHLPLNKVIQFTFLVTINNEPGLVNGNDHPIHIHGHNMQVLKVAYPNYDPVTKAFTTRNSDISCVKDDCNAAYWTNKSWAKGHVPGLLQYGAPRKDSLVIPVGGYVVTRFKTDNPGYWFMHCHLEFHNAEGMSVVLKAGEESDMNAKPRGMRTCSNFRWPEEQPRKTSADDDTIICEEVADDSDLFKMFAITLAIVVCFQLCIGYFIWLLFCSVRGSPVVEESDDEYHGIRYHHLSKKRSQIENSKFDQ